ncbi:MAG: TIGR04282 family arsenosugar biosynthesis glycosyltransferase [Gammaproteobacteria bacterium]
MANTSWQYPHSEILVFVKAPVPGQVKTRLAVDIGNEMAAAVSETMMYQILGMLQASSIAPVTLYVAGDASHPAIETAGASVQKIQPQIEGDLGARMAQAMTTTLASRKKAILIGTDCPIMQIDYLQQALNAESDVVLGPAEDGGYVLIGMSVDTPSIFTGIDWGTDNVLQQTRNKIDQEKLTVTELDRLWDVDYFTDLQRWLPGVTSKTVFTD